MTLNEIGVSEDTDKAALSHRGSHHYADLYELLFREWRTHAPHLLEIGVLDGGSIRMWRRFFPYGRVTAIDVDDRAKFDDPRIEVIRGDAYSDAIIDKLDGREFNIIIDDGSHQPDHQAIFLKRYLPLLAPGGILVVEDVIKKDDAITLKAGLPPGFNGSIVEMNEGNSIIDSRLLIVYRA